MSGTLTLAAASAATEVGRRFGGDVYDSLKGLRSSALTVTREFLEVGFADSISRGVERCSKVKTIVNRYERVLLSKIYEDCHLGLNGNSYAEESITIEESKGNVIISGTAGSGKSFLMKKTFIRMVEINRGYIPIFFELRSLNVDDKPSLLDSIFDFISPKITGDNNLIKRMLSKGKFVLLLDGYDELYEKIRPTITAQIEKIIDKFPRCRVIISGRPSDSFEGWSYFDVYQIEPMSKDSCLSLINKAVFPDEQKYKFYDSVRDTIFESHKEYLSNPLMTYVMMMTADKFIEFPKEMSSFYDKAFETLYSGHDILKSNDFLREVKGNLRMREVSKVLQYFCAVSYADSIFQYDMDLLIKYLEMALSVAKIDKDAEDILDDLVNAYCILIKDGNEYSYIHRSFQEYFAAIGVSNSEKLDFREYNSRVMKANREIEGYFLLLNEVARERFLMSFVIEEVKSYIDEMSPIVRRKPKEFLRRHIDEYGVSESGELRYIAFPGFYDKANYTLVSTIMPIADTRFSDKVFYLSEIDIGSVKGVNAMRSADDGPIDDVKLVFNVGNMNVTDVRRLNVYKYFVQRFDDLKKYIKEIEGEFSHDKTVIGGMRDKLVSKHHSRRVH